MKSKLRAAHDLHELQVADPAIALGDVEDQPRHGDGGEQVHQQMPTVSVTAKPLIWSVPIMYSTMAVMSVVTLASMIVIAGAIEAVANGHAERRPAIQFFPHPLVDEHVGVDRHTDGQRQDPPGRRA